LRPNPAALGGAEHINLKRTKAKSRWQAEPLNLICDFDTTSSLRGKPKQIKDMVIRIALCKAYHQQRSTRRLKKGVDSQPERKYELKIKSNTCFRYRSKAEPRR
jgi:hypothetical protein